MSKNLYSIYWIRLSSHTDPYTEGYVGACKDLSLRLCNHLTGSTNPFVKAAVDKNINDIRIELLTSGISGAAATAIVDRLRPLDRTGWNIYRRRALHPPSAVKIAKDFDADKRIELEKAMYMRAKTKPPYGIYETPQPPKEVHDGV